MYAVKSFFVLTLTAGLTTPSVFAQDGGDPTSLKEVCYQSALSAKKTYPKISVEKAFEVCTLVAIQCLRMTKEDKVMYNDAVKTWAGRTASIRGVTRPLSPEEAVSLTCGLTGAQANAKSLSDGNTKLNE
jgi:hypothetical protein